jgi:hypothetical protein
MVAGESRSGEQMLVLGGAAAHRCAALYFMILDMPRIIMLKYFYNCNKYQ